MNDETSRYNILHALRFLVTPGHECSYLPDQEAVTLFVDPLDDLDVQSYSLLAELGFRRSGEHVYRPHCPACKQCIPVRVLTEHFKPSRSQKRVLKRNSELQVREVAAGFNPQHFALYNRYMNWKHPDSSMNDHDADQYMRMLKAQWMETLLLEIYHQQTLVSVAITDCNSNGLSSVYTFFDPDYALRSLGTFSILQQLYLARQMQLPYLYLGFWIAQCDKMSYKNRFKPAEYFNGHRWLTLE